MKFKHLSRLLVIAISPSLVPAQEELNFELIEQEVDNTKLRAITFETEEGLTYHFEKSVGLQSWESIVSMRGYGDSIVFPFAQLSDGDSPNGGPAANSNPSVSVRLQSVASGGTLVSWISTVSEVSVQHHLPSLTLVPEWSGVPFFYHRGPSLTYFVTRTPGVRTQIPSNLPTLSEGDQEVIDQFVTDYEMIETGVLAGQFQDAVLLPPIPPGEKGFIRVLAEVSDSDRDGIPDAVESSPNGNFGTDPDNPDSDGDGVWDGAEVVQGDDPTDGEDQQNCDEPGGNEGGGGLPLFGVIEVGFHNDHKLTSDSGLVNYRAPQWKKKSHNYPVGYSRNATITLSGKFAVSGPIKAQLPNGIQLPLTGLIDLGNNEYKLPKTACTGALDDVIKIYDSEDPEKSFQIIWLVETTLNGQPFDATVGVTHHTVYVTYQDPIVSGNRFATKQRQETLFNIGCRRASGMKDNTDNAIANAIYQEFTGRQVARVEPTKVTRRNETLAYYNPQQTNSSSVVDFLKDEGNNLSGSCGSWASLLNHTLRAQGINANIVRIQPVAPNSGFQIRFGIPAQGNQTPPLEWGQHCITESNGFLYEVSHGTAAIPPLGVQWPIQLGLPDIKAYEDIHVELYTRLENGETVFDVNNTEASNPSQMQMEFIPSFN